jgi:hypothetical protein
MSEVLGGSMRTVLFYLLVIAGIGAMLPPFFTQGACSAEFNAVSDSVERARSGLLTLSDAEHYLAQHGIGYQLLSAERCETAAPPDVVSCPGGPLLLGTVPVKNAVCRFYRDASVRVQLGFNSRSQLVRIQTDMNPYKILRLPFVNVELDLGK